MFKDIYLIPYKNLTFKIDNTYNDIKMKEKQSIFYSPYFLCFESKSFS